MAVDTITVEALALRPALPVLDIREAAERYEGIGFIPGSSWHPGSEIGPDVGAWFAALALGDGPVAVVCMSGRRSRALVEKLVLAGVSSVLDVEGGTVAWQSAGLPVVHPSDADVVSAAIEEATRHENGLSPELFRRSVLACFIAESIERATDDAPADPLQDVDGAFAGGVPTDLAAARESVERLAVQARRQGHSLSAIARNVSHFVALARFVEWDGTPQK